MLIFNRNLLLVLSLCIYLLPISAMGSSKQAADLVLYNAKVYTVESSKPWAQAVAVKNGKIVYVGDNSKIKNWLGKETVQQDMQGKLLLPGFIDSHAHPVMGGAYVNSLSLDSFATPSQWLKQVADYAKENSEAEILFGYGFLASAFGSQGPTSAMLDKVVADKAVLILDEGFHGGWANSKAMQLLGITKLTKDPTPGFSYYKRDSQGNPTGYLLEGTATAAIEKLGVITADSVAKGTSDVIDIMNSYGITAVFDAGASDVDALQLKVLEKIAAQGRMTVRMVASHMIGDPKQAATAIDNVKEKSKKSKPGMYHINTLKIMNDGTIEGKTAGMFEDYQGEPGNSGETVFSQTQMNELLSQASAENIDVHIHALGERTIAETLNAIEIARLKYPQASNRFAICHIQVMKDKDIERFARLNVIAQSTPLWTSYDEFGKAFVSDEQFNRYFRFNGLKKAGVKQSFGSDFPATGAGVLGMSPIFNIEIGHTRQNPGEPDAPIQPNIDERLDIATLIKGYTLDAAYQLHMEESIGSIKVGKNADFVVLKQNIFAVNKYDIHKVEVLQTILAGKTVYAQ